LYHVSIGYAAELRAKEVLRFHKKKKGIRPASAPPSHMKLLGGHPEDIDEEEDEDLTFYPATTGTPLPSPIKKTKRPASSPAKRTSTSAGGTRK
jgi:hypothetical protein